MSVDVLNKLKNKERNSTIQQEKSKLLHFINSRMPSVEDAEDVLQDVFYEFVELTSETGPIERAAFKTCKNIYYSGNCSLDSGCRRL